MQIRIYLKTDFQAIADIYNESIAIGGVTMDLQAYSSDDIAAIVKKFNHRETILVAQKENQVIGWGIIKRYSDRPGYYVCCETSIYLGFSSTGKGYGHSLQNALSLRAGRPSRLVRDESERDQSSVKSFTALSFSW